MIVFWSTCNIVCVVWFIFSFSYCSLVMQLVGLLIFFFFFKSVLDKVFFSKLELRENEPSDFSGFRVDC